MARGLSVDGVDVPYTATAKYLGVIYDRRLTWKPHVHTLKQSFHGRLSQIAPLLRSPSLSLATKIMLYRSYLRSALTYAIAAWFGIANAHLATLQVLQNRSLRMIGGYDRATPIVQMHEDHLPYFTEYAQSIARALYHKALHNTNPLISELGAYDPRDFSSHKMPLHHL